MQKDFKLKCITLFVEFFIFFNLLSPHTMYATTVPGKKLHLTLREAVVLALRFNTSVQIEDLQRIIDKFSLQVAEWQFDIHYNLTGSASYNHSVSAGTRADSDSESITPGATLLVPLGTLFSLQMVNSLSHSAPNPRYYNPSLTFSMTQPLLQGFGPDITLAPLHTAENQELINRLNFQNILIQTITNVISQYIALVQAKYNIKVQKLSLKNSIDTLDQQKAMLKVGRIAASDLLQFQASVASQQLSLEQLEVSYLQQQRQLLITLGIDPTISLEVSNDAHLPTENIPQLSQCIDMALATNIGYQQQVLNVKNSQISLQVAADNQRPSLDLTASQTQGGGSGGLPDAGIPSLFNGRNSNSTVSLSLTVPIDDLSLQQSYLQAKIGLKQAELTLIETKRNLINDVTNAYYILLNQKEQITQAELAVKLAQQTLNIALAKLKYGKVSPFEASTLQTNLLTAQINYITTVAAYVTNLATLDQVLGYTLKRWHIKMSY